MTDRNVILPVTPRDFSQYGAPSWAKYKIIFRKDSNYEDFRGTKFYRSEEAAKNALTKKDKLIEKTKLANLKPKEPPKADKFLIKVGKPTKTNNVIKQKFKEVIGSKNVPSTYKETGVEKTLYRAQISVNDKTVLSTEFGKESDAIKAVKDYRKTNPIKNAPPDLKTLDARKKKRYLEKQKRSKDILARGGYPAAGPFAGDLEIHKGHAGNIRGKEMITGDRLIRTPAIINQMMGGDESVIATKNRFTDLDYKIEKASDKIEEVKNSNMSAAKKKIELNKLDTKLMKYAADSDGYKVVTLSDGNTYGGFARPLQSIDPFGDFPGMTEKEIGSFLNKYKNMKVTPGMPQSEIDNIIKAGLFIENIDVSKQAATKANDLFKLARKDAIANGPICGIVQKKNKGGSVISCVDAVEDAIQNNPQKLAQDVSKIGKFKQAATGFLNFLKGPGPKTFGIGAGVGAAIGLVKKFRNDDPTTYLSNEDQQKNMLVDMATQPVSVDIDRPAILDYQLPALGVGIAGSTALAAPSTIRASKTDLKFASRAPGVERKKPGVAKTGLRVLGRGLGVAASPALLAPLAAGDIASQIAAGDSPMDIATDPLNYLYPAFADQTPKLTRGLNPTLFRKAARFRYYHKVALRASF